MKYLIVNETGDTVYPIPEMDDDIVKIMAVGDKNILTGKTKAFSLWEVDGVNLRFIERFT